MDIAKYIKSNEEALIKATCDILKIKSVEEDSKPGMPFGEGPARALEFALQLAENFGLRTKNLDNYIGWAEWGEGEELVGIPVHLDVVPEGHGWTYPPYGGEIHDGKIYGRGASDDKGPAMAALFALKTLKEAGVKFNRRVRVIFGTNEESGMMDVDYYKKHDEEPDMGFSPDAEFPIINGEKGIMTFKLAIDFEKCRDGIIVKKLSGGHRPNMVPDYAEAVLMNCHEDTDLKLNALAKNKNYQAEINQKGPQVIIKCYGVSAHGSTPERGKNAVMHLVSLLDELNIAESQKTFIHFLNEKIGEDTTGKGLGVAFSDDISGALTFNVGVARMDEDYGEVVINIRYPIRTTGAEVIEGIKANLEGGVRMEDISDSEPHYVPEDNHMIKDLKAAYEKVTGEKAYCFTIGGGTYARHFNNSVAFGPLFPGKPELAHEKDEYIEIEDLLKNFSIYTYVLEELVK